MTENKNIVSNKIMKEIEFTDYKTALNKQGEMYLARDLNDKGAKDYTNCSMEQLRHYLDDDYNLYEILKEDKPQKMYIDFDCKYHSIEEIYKDKDDSDIKNEIIGTIEGMIEDYLVEYNIRSDLPDVHVLDSSNKIKFSFHLCVDLKLKNFNESKVFHNKFLKFVNERYTDDPEYNNLHKYIDPCVYTKNRLIRLPNQSKFGQDRPLKILKGSKDLKDHIITSFERDIGDVKVPDVWLRQFTNKNKKIELIKTKVKSKDYSTDKELQWLVKNTKHKTDKYDDWIKWVWACIGSGISPEDIHKISYEGCPEKYDASSTDKVIEQYLQDKSNLGFHSLKFWASEVGKYLEREIEKNETHRSKKRYDHITWLDLLKKYHNKVFDSYDHMIEETTSDISQVISYIQGGQSVFTMYTNDEKPFEMTKYPPILCLQYKDDKLISKINLTKLMMTNPLAYPLYNKIVFKPMGYGLKRHEKNTFSGFEAEIEDDYNEDLIRPILHHIREVLANGNEEHYRYIMSWFWRILNEPWNKTQIFLLFYGEQGTGKTIIADFLIEYIIGKNLSFSTNGIKPLTQRFNGCTMSKIFCCCNELSTISDTGSNWHAGFDSMKNLITDKLISVEKKGLEHIMIENHINFMGTTNNPNAIKVEKGDRRYACFEVSNKYKGDYEYFDKLGESMKLGGNDFLTYMTEIYPKEDLVNLRKIPTTQFRKNLMENSKTPVDRFIDDLLSDDYTMDERKWISKEEKEISKKGLYEEYLFWCGENGEKDKAKHIFFRNISKDRLAIDLSKNLSKSINGKRIKYVKFM